MMRSRARSFNILTLAKVSASTKKEVPKTIEV